MKIVYIVPDMPFENGENAFKKPPFWYRYVGRGLVTMDYIYILFPINLYVRFKTWINEKKKKTIRS